MRLSSDHAAPDDQELIRLIAQSRQPQALDQLYDRYNRLVFGLAVLIVGDSQTAEEVTLDVFMRVWQKAATYRGEQASVRTWLTYITRHHSIDVLRRRRTRPEQYALALDEIASRLVSGEDDPLEAAEESARQRTIQAALDELPPDQKQAVVLAYFGGLTQSQIASALDQPLGTIKTRIRLGMQKLRDLFKEDPALADKSVGASSSYNISEEQP